MSDVPLLALYGLPLAAALFVYLWSRRSREADALAVMRTAEQAGLTEPATIHPVIDPSICVGSGACVRACPEKTLAIVKGKGHQINPSACIGHGACAAACPVEAIHLVFGSARRGIEIPYVKPNFESNVDGLFIAGELGGVGLIRKAAEQGRQAMRAIGERRAANGELDVVIVGAGPAGISSTLAAMEAKLKFVTLEQEEALGGTVYHYPRNKIVSTQPVVLPIVGKAELGEISKESLLDFWRGVVSRVGVPIDFGQCMQKIERLDDGFLVRTSRVQYRTRSVLLAIGRRGTPRKLGVAGEELPKVLYQLRDAEQYRGQRVLVVGGGDSAIEAALGLAAQPATQVTLSYRGDAFGRIKEKNRQRLGAMEHHPQLEVLLRSAVQRIEERRALLDMQGKSIVLDNDYVIVCAGGVLPTPMLKEIGVTVETKYGTA
jgi:thioredoxin reductase/Pyruvate/2-oxoacid:ferredoxin oxidoreductase delta subunit